jgi:signal transduction histidine kinase
LKIDGFLPGAALKRLGGVEGERSGTRLKKPAPAKRRPQRKTVDGSRDPTLHQQLDQRTRELRELQQAATSKVLEFISSSRGDLAPVFRVILENAVRFCGAKFGNLWLREGDFFRIGAMHGAPPAYTEMHRREPVTRAVPGTALARAATTKKAVQIADVRKEKGCGGSGPLHVGPEKQGFNIALQRLFDPTAGEVDLFPQEITRVLLNPFSNGFYAATKREAQDGASRYEPTLAASTKNLGDSVEIRIRDNGSGIPPEVREQMFNPFFTTKPAGEGTGLGLSISHDIIIVKQHGGSIDVDTTPGEYTEFRIVLPRKAAILAKTGAPA